MFDSVADDVNMAIIHLAISFISPNELYVRYVWIGNCLRLTIIEFNIYLKFDKLMLAVRKILMHVMSLSVM